MLAYKTSPVDLYQLQAIDLSRTRAIVRQVARMLGNTCRATCFDQSLPTAHVTPVEFVQLATFPPSDADDLGLNIVEILLTCLGLN